MTLSEKLVFLRERDALSQAELAERIGVAKKTLIRWERGEAMPDIRQIVLIAQIFSVSTDSLLIDSRHPEKDAEKKEDGERRHVTVAEAAEYLKEKIRAAYLVAAATLIMVIAPGVMLVIMSLPFRAEWVDTLLGITTFFLLAALSASIYIYARGKTARYDFISRGNFSLDYGATDMLARAEEKIMLSYAVRNTVAILLCILSLAPLIIAAMIEGISDLGIMIAITASLLIAGLGIVMFITSGLARSSISALNHSRTTRTYSKHLEDSVKRGFWILVIGFYLLYSFVSKNWHLSWLIFIFAAGIAFLISAAFTLVRRANGEDTSDEDE